MLFHIQSIYIEEFLYKIVKQIWVTQIKSLDMNILEATFVQEKEKRHTCNIVNAYNFASVKITTAQFIECNPSYFQISTLAWIKSPKILSFSVLMQHLCTLKLP